MEDRRIKKTKKALIDSLLELLSNKPLTAITVTELCEIADVNRSSFYKYYTHVEDLMEQIEDDLIDIFMHQWHNTENVSNSIFLQLISTIYVHRKIYNHIFNAQNRTRFLNKFFSAIQKDLFESFKRNVIEEANVLDHYFFTFITAGNIGIIEKWIEREYEETAEEIAIWCEKYTNAVIETFKG